MKKLSLLLLVGLLLVPGMVMASTFKYYIPITISNNSSENITGIPVLVFINNTQLASLGYILSSGLDTDVTCSGVYTPSMLAGDRLAFFIGSLIPGQNKTYAYKLGLSPARTSMPVIVGYGGNVTVSDDPLLEPGDDFKFEWEVYLPAGNEMLIEKEDAFYLYTLSGNVVAQIAGSHPGLASHHYSVGLHLVTIELDGEDFTVEVT